MHNEPRLSTAQTVIRSLLNSSDTSPATGAVLRETSNGDSQAACRAAVSDDRDRIAQHLNDDIIRGLFGVGLRLQATAQLADLAVQTRLVLAIHDLDLIIAEVRSVIFDALPEVS